MNPEDNLTSAEPNGDSASRRFEPAERSAVASADFESRIASLTSTIARFTALKRNWDSYGGEPATRAAITSVSYLLGYLLPSKAAPELSPLPNGGIGLEWTSNDAEIIIEVGPTGLACLLVESLDLGVEAEVSLITPSKLLLEYSTILAQRLPFATLGPAIR